MKIKMYFCYVCLWMPIFIKVHSVQLGLIPEDPAENGMCLDGASLNERLTFNQVHWGHKKIAQ